MPVPLSISAQRGLIELDVSIVQLWSPNRALHCSASDCNATTPASQVPELLPLVSCWVATSPGDATATEPVTNPPLRFTSVTAAGRVEAVVPVCVAAISTSSFGPLVKSAGIVAVAPAGEPWNAVVSSEMLDPDFEYTTMSDATAASVVTGETSVFIGTVML